MDVAFNEIILLQLQVFPFIFILPHVIIMQMLEFHLYITDQGEAEWGLVNLQ